MKLDNDMIERIFDLARQGQPIETICNLCGISRRAFINWRTRGEEHYKQGMEDEYSQFHVMLQRGTASFINDNIKVIAEASKKDWKAAAWLLERRCPEYFAIKQEVKANVEGVTIKNDIGMGDIKKDGDIAERIDC